MVRQDKQDCLVSLVESENGAANRPVFVEKLWIKTTSTLERRDARDAEIAERANRICRGGSPSDLDLNRIGRTAGKWGTLRGSCCPTGTANVTEKNGVCTHTSDFLVR